MYNALTARQPKTLNTEPDKPASSAKGVVLRVLVGLGFRVLVLLQEGPLGIRLPCKGNPSKQMGNLSYGSEGRASDRKRRHS